MNPAVEDRHSRAAEEAADWLERLERTITLEEGRALRRWLRASMHREAIVARCKLWHGPEVLAVLGEIIPTETFRQRVEKHYDHVLVAIVLAVSGLALLTVLIAVSKQMPGQDKQANPLRAEVDLRTTIGEHRTIHLPDGGSIIMNTATRILLTYLPHSRSAILKGGEATFEVKGESERPFVVYSGSRRLEVQPEGAIFNLYRVASDRTEVVVMQGKLHVAANRSPAPLSPALLRARVSQTEHFLVAGQSAMLGDGWEMLMTLESPQLERKFAWHTGRLVFVGATLEDVTAEMQRYTDQTLRLVDQRLSNVPVTVELNTSDIAGFLRYANERFKMQSHTGDVVVTMPSTR